MRGPQPLHQRNGVLDELEDTRLSSERNDLVASDAQVTLLGFTIPPEYNIDQIEDLLHHRVLP